LVEGSTPSLATGFSMPCPFLFFHCFLSANYARYPESGDAVVEEVVKLESGIGRPELSSSTRRAR
jgi:hypothetical protein